MPAPFEFKGVVRLTRLGAGYLLFTLLIGFAAINTGNNSLYIALAFMLGSLIVSGVASREGLRRISVRVEGLDEAWSGSPAWAAIKVENRSRIWNVRDLVIVAPELERPLNLAFVPRRSSLVIEGAFLFQHRGRVRFRSADLYTRYPFGLFLKKRKVEFGGEAIVFPRLLSSAIEPRRLGSLEGEIPSTSRPGAGSEIFAFREYVRGDSLRLVHWKKSASLGRWIMKQPELESGRIVRIALDPVASPDNSEGFEEMVSEAATLAHHALSLGLEVVLEIPPASIRSREGSGRQQLFEALALVEPTSSGPEGQFEPGTFVFSLRRPHAA